MADDLLSALAPGVVPPVLRDLHPAAARRPRAGATDLSLGLGVTPAGLVGRDADPETVRGAAQLLESYFLTLLIEEMRGPYLFDEDEDGLFAPSREELLFTQQLDQVLGEELARTGQLGLADLIVRQLLPEAPPA